MTAQIDEPTKEMDNQREHLQKLLINGQIEYIVAEKKRYHIHTCIVTYGEFDKL
jgi:hypothetical protein